MKKLLLMMSIMIFANNYAATVWITNKSGKTIQAGIPYRDFGLSRAATFIFPIAGAVTTAQEAIKQGQDFSWELRETRKQDIAPGKSAWFDSGLTAIKSIAFFMDGRPIAVFNPDIGVLQVEQHVDFYNADDIRRV